MSPTDRRRVLLWCLILGGLVGLALQYPIYGLLGGLIMGATTE